MTELLERKGIWVWAAPVLPAAVEALVASRRVDDAGRLADRFRAGLTGRDAPYAQAALQLCTGLVAGAGGHLAGGRADAAVHRLLNSVRVTFAGLRLGRLAGELLGAARVSSSADALVMAEAIRGGPAILLTSDPDEMRRLADGSGSVVVVAV